jgi:hypothetical protein
MPYNLACGHTVSKFGLQQVSCFPYLFGYISRPTSAL